MKIYGAGVFPIRQLYLLLGDGFDTRFVAFQDTTRETQAIGVELPVRRCQKPEVLSLASAW